MQLLGKYFIFLCFITFPAFSMLVQNSDPSDDRVGPIVDVPTHMIDILPGTRFRYPNFSLDGVMESLTFSSCPRYLESPEDFVRSKAIQGEIVILCGGLAMIYMHLAFEQETKGDYFKYLATPFRVFMALVEVTQPRPKVKPRTHAPFEQEGNAKLTPSQAIDWLKKTANSKCSYFRKNNVELLFSRFVLDEDNYKLFYHEFNRVLEESRGLAPYALIKKSLQAFDDATQDEAKSLRDAIFFSISTYINDSSSFVDIKGAVLALKEIQEKGLISELTHEQIDGLGKEIDEAGQIYLNEGKEQIRKYFPPDVDFAKLTIEEIANFRGYQGAKAELERERKGFQTVREFSRKLNDLLGQKF